MKLSILKTKLLYHYDEENKTNFHTYIDGKANIVIIIKLKNGFFLAAYSEDSF